MVLSFLQTSLLKFFTGGQKSLGYVKREKRGQKSLGYVGGVKKVSGIVRGGSNSFDIQKLKLSTPSHQDIYERSLKMSILVWYRCLVLDECSAMGSSGLPLGRMQVVLDWKCQLAPYYKRLSNVYFYQMFVKCLFYIFS